MVKQQVNEKLLRPDVKWVLAPDEREARPKFQQKRADVREQSDFHVSLLRVIAKRQKIEIVRVFQQVAHQIGLRRGQGALEVRDGFALPLMQARLYLML